MIVTFNCVEVAQKWLDITPTDFIFLSDINKLVYSCVNLKRSYLKTWHMSALEYYSERIVSGDVLLNPLATDDLEQMGGDVVVDSCGKVLYSHLTEATVGRPSPEVLVSVISSRM